MLNCVCRLDINNVVGLRLFYIVVILKMNVPSSENSTAGFYALRSLWMQLKGEKDSNK